MPVTVPDNCVSLDAGQTAGNYSAVVSTNPSMSFTDISTPAADGYKTDVLMILPSSKNLALPGKIPVVSGERIYCAFSASGSAVLYFSEDNLS